MPEVVKEPEKKPEAKIDQIVLQNLQARGCQEAEWIMELARDSIKGRQVDYPKSEEENFLYARDMLAFVPKLEARGYTTHEAYELVENTRTPADMIFFSSTRLHETDYDVGVLKDKFKYIREHPEANYRDATVAMLFKGPKVVPEFRKAAEPEEEKPVIASIPKRMTPKGKGEMDDLLYSKDEIARAETKRTIENEMLSKRNNDREEAALIMQYAFHWAETGKDLGPVEDDFKEDYEFARAAVAFMPGLITKGYSVEDARNMVENAMIPKDIRLPGVNENEKDTELIAAALAGRKEGQPVGELAFSGPAVDTVDSRIEKEVLAKRNNNIGETDAIMKYARYWARTGMDLGEIPASLKDDYESARAALRFMPGLIAKGYTMDDARTTVQNAMASPEARVPVPNADERDVEMIARALSGEERVVPGGAPPQAATQVASAQKYQVEVRGEKYFVTLSAPLEGNAEDAFLDMLRNHPENVISFQMGEKTMGEDRAYLLDFIKGTFLDIYQNAYNADKYQKSYVNVSRS